MKLIVFSPHHVLKMVKSEQNGFLVARASNLLESFAHHEEMSSKNEETGSKDKEACRKNKVSGRKNVETEDSAGKG